MRTIEFFVYKNMRCERRVVRVWDVDQAAAVLKEYGAKSGAFEDEKKRVRVVSV